MPDFLLLVAFFLATPSLFLAGRWLTGLLDNPRPDFLRLVVTPTPSFSFWFPTAGTFSRTEVAFVLFDCWKSGRGQS